MNQCLHFTCLALLGSALVPDAVAAPRPVVQDVVQARQQMATLSVPFVPNAGQWDPRAAFAVHTFAGTLFVTTDGQLVYSLPGKELDETAAGPAIRPASHRQHVPRLRSPGGC